MAEPASPAIDRRILRHDSSVRRLITLAVAAGLLTAALTIGRAVVLASIIAGVFIDGRTLTEVRGLLVALAAIAVAMAGSTCAGTWLAGAAAERLKAALRRDLVGQMAAMEPQTGRSRRSGELVSLASTSVDDLEDYVSLYLPQRYLVGLVPVLVGLAVLVIDPLSAGVLLLTGPLLLALLMLIGGRAQALTQRRHEQLSWLSADFLDLLQALPTLKMFGRSREQAGRIRDVSRAYGDSAMDVLRTAFETAFVLELCSTVATALVAVETGLRLLPASMPFEAALAVLLLTPEFFQPLRQFSMSYHAGMSGRVAAAAIFGVLDAAPPQPTRGSAVSSSGAVTVAFNDVHASYDGDRPALRGVSFRLEPGTTTLLVGPVGAGKSTVANVLLRFLEPDSGCITVDGQPLENIDRAEWLRNVAWVPQQPYLFNATVAENIALGHPHACMNDIVAAARLAQADAFIRCLSHGYDTIIGERGARLSGGQRQCIAVARAFFKDSPLLVLDEPSSHLDAESQACLRDVFIELMRGRTVLAISHMPELVTCATQVIRLHDGRVEEVRNPLGVA